MMEEEDVLEEGEIDESDITTSSVGNQFTLSHATREPQTICSEESSNDNTDNSDDDSDAQCSKPKKPKPQSQLPIRNHVPNKYKVWSLALQEEALMENLTKCDVDAIDRERSVESYNYKIVDKTDYSQYSGYHMPVSECHFLESDYVKCKDEKQFAVGSKRRHSDIKKRIGHKKDYLNPRRLPNLAVTVNDSVQDVAEDIALKLRETKRDLILNVVLVLGKQRAIELYNETKGVEDNGGMLLMNGERRRTPGGVYLLLLKRDDRITSEDMKQIFADDKLLIIRKKKRLSKKKSKKKAQQIKETLIREKLLNLNTATSVQSCETKQSEVQEGVGSNHPLEEGELELNVTNPPPSPATDQDTPPSRTLGAYSEDEAEHNHVEQQDNLGRKVVTYEEVDDDDDDYLEVDVDDMDVF